MASTTRTFESKADREPIRYCQMKPAAPRVFGPEVSSARESLILTSGTKWVNGTILHYYFFERDTDGANVVLENGTTEWRPWTTTDAEKDVVRRAFAAWKNLGIGLEFQEVPSRTEAEIRIGFMRGDGAWSYVGREVLRQGSNQRTMNFGWDLTAGAPDLDTAIHEIGHTLGFPHEHQNPNSGIVWNEQAVYDDLAGPPNFWRREDTYHNIIRKIPADTVQGSAWDPNSIMHYPFGPGLIDRPVHYRNGLSPRGGLSARDAAWVKTFYPPLAPASFRSLTPLVSVPLAALPGDQTNFIVEPEATREYEFRTFGESDAVMVLFEEDQGGFRFLAGDDDSGATRNTTLRVKLLTGHKYLLRVRVYYSRSSEIAVMMF
jgi:hypothetical protein